MNITSLKSDEALELLDHYKSECKKLKFQLKKTNEIIESIEKHLKKSGKKEKHFSTTQAAAAPRTQHHVGKQTQVTIEKISDGIVLVTPPTSTRKRSGKKATGGYRLSEWDRFILDSLENEERPLVNAEFNEMALAYAKETNNPESEEKIRGKITRSIHKLANKRMSIRKHNISGKGFAYGLADWFSKAGKLKREFKNKL